MKLMPASSARWMTRMDSSWSGLPHSPNIMVPRHSSLTCTPVRPRGRSSMSVHPSRRTGAAVPGGSAGKLSDMPAGVTLRRLAPQPGELTPEEATSGLRLGERAPAHRPYVVGNMVATVDGHATLAGRSGPIGDEVDRRSSTGCAPRPMRSWRGPGRCAPSATGAWCAIPPTGRAASARAWPRSAGGRDHPQRERPLRHPALRGPRLHRRALRAPHAHVEDCPAEVRVTRLDPADLRPGVVLPRLRADHGVRSVLCEGGPTLNRSLIADDALDELFLSVAPKLTAEGEALPLISGPALASRWSSSSSGSWRPPRRCICATRSRARAERRAARRRSRRRGRRARPASTAGGRSSEKRWGSIASRMRSRVGLAEAHAEAAADDHGLDVEHVARPTRRRRRAPRRRASMSSLGERRRRAPARAPRCRWSAGRGRAPP